MKRSRTSPGFSLLEVIVSATMDAFGWERRKAALLGGLGVTLLGTWSAFRIDILDLADSVATNLFLVGGGLALSIFVGWVMHDPIAEASAGRKGDAPVHGIWRILLRFVVPLALIWILWNSLPETWEKFRGVVGLG